MRSMIGEIKIKFTDKVKKSMGERRADTAV